jgi:hypothetical protein
MALGSGSRTRSIRAPRVGATSTEHLALFSSDQLVLARRGAAGENSVPAVPDQVRGGQRHQHLPQPAQPHGRGAVDLRSALAISHITSSSLHGMPSRRDPALLNLADAAARPRRVHQSQRLRRHGRNSTMAALRCRRPAAGGQGGPSSARFSPARIASSLSPSASMRISYPPSAARASEHVSSSARVRTLPVSDQLVTPP